MPLRAVLRWGAAVVLAAWGLLVLAWLVLHWAILPQAHQWRPALERRATQALGVPVQIGRIEVQSRGWVPHLRLDDVVLRDPQGRPALTLPQVHAAVSVRSLLTLSLRFEQLLIDQPDLEVRRDRDGRLFVAGLPMQGGGSGDTSAADWFFEQGEFVLRRGQLRWVDEQRGAAPLVLRDVDLVVRNGLRRHALRIDATPPAEWGERFSLRGQFRQPLLARSGDWRRWTGSLYAQLPRADIAQLRRHVALPFELNAGEGALRGWVDLQQGEFRRATVDVALNAVNLRLQRNLEPLELSLLQGRFGGERDEQGVQVSAEQLRFVTGDGERWLPSRLQVSWQQRQDLPQAPVTGGRLTADRLDLALMAGIAERLPLGTAVRRLLDETAPQGQVHELVATWDGPVDAPSRYSVDGKLRGVTLSAGATEADDDIGRPGWRNADVDLKATEAGGDATLSMQHGALLFPGVFADAEVPLDRLEAQLSWRVLRARGTTAALPASGNANAAPRIELQVRRASFENPHAAGELQASWHTGPGEGTGAGRRFPGVLDMSGRLSRGEATAVARYLPLSIPASAREYVATAVQAGRVDSANFKVRGDLWQFPYAQARDGEFRIAGRVSGVQLAYVPPEGGRPSPWPAFTGVSGDLLFDRSSMEIRNASAQALGYELSRVQGRIPDLEQPVLSIEGQGRGALADALRYVDATPVAGWIEDALRPAHATGGSELRLALVLPMDDLSKSTVRGRVTLAGNEVRLRPDVPVLAQARGRIDFTHRGFTLQGVQARALGGEVNLEGGTQADGHTRITAHGTVSAEGLRGGAETPWLARLGGVMQGQTPYRLSLGFVHGHTEFSLSSPLTGMALDLPAPLGKAADVPMALLVQSQLQSETLAGSAPRDTLRIELGSIAQAQFVRDLAAPDTPVLRGAIGVLEPLPALAPGIAAQVNLARLDVDAWRQVASRLTGPSAPRVPGAGTGSASGTGAAGNTAAPALAGGFLPQQLALQAREMKVAGRRLTEVSAVVSPTVGEAGWRVNLLARELAGVAEYRPAAGPAGRVHARLRRLALPPSEVSGMEQLLDEAPSQMPALDIVVDELELGGKRLGRLEVEAAHRGESGREWRLNKLNLTMPEARFTGSGTWSAATVLQPRRRMQLDFALDIADSGGLLQRLGTPDAIKGGRGQVKGEVAWLGSPFEPDYPSLNGRLHLELDEGQFLKAGPGAGRLLGVLSLQSLPRRLLLDFRDVFQQGFAFDQFAGDVTIRDGVASSQNLRMRGLQAVVLMEGQADLERETHNLRVVVVPEINAGAASLAYAAINPAVGLGTFLAQMVLRKPLMQAGTREFLVSGSWDEPKVERVERGLADPLPELEPQAPAAVPVSPAASSPPTAR